MPRLLSPSFYSDENSSSQTPSSDNKRKHIATSYGDGFIILENNFARFTYSLSWMPIYGNDSRINDLVKSLFTDPVAAATIKGITAIEGVRYVEVMAYAVKVNFSRAISNADMLAQVLSVFEKNYNYCK